MATISANTTLEDDRKTLLEIRDTMAGTASLNWSLRLPTHVTQ